MSAIVALAHKCARGPHAHTQAARTHPGRHCHMTPTPQSRSMHAGHDVIRSYIFMYFRKPPVEEPALPARKPRVPRFARSKSADAPASDSGLRPSTPRTASASQISTKAQESTGRNPTPKSQRIPRDEVAMKAAGRRSRSGASQHDAHRCALVHERAHEGTYKCTRKPITTCRVFVGSYVVRKRRTSAVFIPKWLRGWTRNPL